MAETSKDLPEDELGGEDFARRIYDRLEREDRLNYERIKIEDEIRQKVISWLIAALAALGAFLSGAAYISYDRIIDSIAGTIEQSLDDKVNAALETKLDGANRQMEDVFRRSDELLSRELVDVSDAKKQVESTVIEAKSAIASLEAQTDFVRSAAVKASDAALDSTRAAEASRQQVSELGASVGAIRSELEARAQDLTDAITRADDIQVSIRGSIQKLNDERVSLSADIVRLERRLAVVEEALIGLNGSLETTRVAELRAQEARLELLQKLKIVFYVSRADGGADIPRVIALHDGLIAKGVPNNAYATEDNESFDAIAAEIDSDFTGVRRFLKGGAYQVFAAPQAEQSAIALIEELNAIDSEVRPELVLTEFVIGDEKFLERARGGRASPQDVVLITKAPRKAQ